MNRSALRAAFPATVPVMTGYFCLGFAYGLLMVSQGFSPIWPVLMSLVVFGGSIQFLAVTLLGSAFAPIPAFFLSLMVNARHIFYGLSMLEKYRATGGMQYALIPLLTDETFSVVSSTEPPEGVSHRAYCGSPCWITATGWEPPRWGPSLVISCGLTPRAWTLP